MDERIEHGAELVSALVSARTSYTTSPVYDEIVADVSARIEESSSVGKVDIGALLLWKRLRANSRWVPRLLVMPDADVRRVTRDAVAAARDTTVDVSEAAKRGRAALSTLPGFRLGDALASAVLFASAPERMAVYDRRADAALKRLVGVDLGTKPRRYERYMSTVDQLVAAVNRSKPDRPWTARDVDLALYMLGGPED